MIHFSKFIYVLCMKSQISGEYENIDCATKITRYKSAKSPFTSTLLQMV